MLTGLHPPFLCARIARQLKLSKKRLSVVHNVLMFGPPGAGKTLLARAIPSILPRMTIEEALYVTRIYSLAGQLPSDVPLIRNWPFRAPHHTISRAGLVGGAAIPAAADGCVL